MFGLKVSGCQKLVKDFACLISEGKLFHRTALPALTALAVQTHITRKGCKVINIPEVRCDLCAGYAGVVLVVHKGTK